MATALQRCDAGAHESTPRLPLRLLLRRETAELHARAELALGMPETLTSLGRYRALLELWVGFYVPVEGALERFTEWSSLGLSLEKRRKTPWLDADLMRLGSNSLAVPACRALPELSNFERALGAMYVFEGATLGAQVIGRAARRMLGPIPARFLDGYGPSTGSMWRQFTDALARHDGAGADARDVVIGATLTFRSLEQWTIDARWAR